MQYNEMTISHVSQIAELEKQCFSAPWSEKSIISELNNPLSLWIVAVENDRVVGYVGSQSVMGEADMMNLAVNPEYRRKGIAEHLVSELITRLCSANVACLTLEVRQSNLAAIALYEKMGFVSEGIRPKFYERPTEDAMIMWRR